MNTKNKFSLVVLPVITLLLMVAAQMAAPVRAQAGAWDETSLPAGYVLAGIKFFDSDHGRAYGMKYDGTESIPFIFETTDGGATWTEERDGLKKLEKWSKSSSVTISGTTLSSECKYSHAEEVFVIDADLIYAEAIVHCRNRMSGGYDRESDNPKIFRTKDNGQTWSPIIMSGEAEDGRVTNIIPAPGGSVWIVLYDNTAMLQQFMFSSDGITFNPRFIGDLPNNTVKDLTFPGSDFGYAEVSISSMEDKRYRHSVRITKDDGETWTALPPLPDLQFESLSDFFFLDERTGWAVGYTIGEWGFHSAFLRTVDGGNTWEETLFPASEDILPDAFLTMRQVKFQNPSVGFAIGEYQEGDSVQGVLYMSADGGTVWEEILRRPSIGCLETTDTQVIVCMGNSILRMELPAPRPTPTPTSTPTSTPTLTPVPPTKTPISSATPTPVASGWEAVKCAGAPALILFFFVLIWLLLVKR